MNRWKRVNNQANNRQNIFWTEETLELQIERVRSILGKTNGREKKHILENYSKFLRWGELFKGIRAALKNIWNTRASVLFQAIERRLWLRTYAQP